MEIKKTNIKIKDLCEGYVNDSETDIEKGVYAYGGKLCVRPAFQRMFVYKEKEERAVINTVLKGFPLNIMYWVDNGDGTYDCLDGQQRTISLCNFVDGATHFHASWLTGDDPKKYWYIDTLKRNDPDLYEKFMNYELEVYICKGTKAEQMEWFNTINIAGKALTVQELRNACFVSKWLTDAKKYFSKANAQSTAKCPAERIGKAYINTNANRQELLEQVISWRAGSKEDADICRYMEEHINDQDASDLWNYFNDVIEWVKSIFVNDPSEYEKDALKKVEWGFLYNNYKDVEFDPDEIDTLYTDLVNRKANNEFNKKVYAKNLLTYCITKDISLIEPRAFTDTQRLAMHKAQNGICPKCGQYFPLSKMEAHHKIAWSKGGTTETANGVLICKKCHSEGHADFDF